MAAKAASITVIRATLSEMRAGMGRIAGPLLRKWRARAAAECADDLVGIIDRELQRRVELVGADVRAAAPKAQMPWRE